MNDESRPKAALETPAKASDQIVPLENVVSLDDERSADDIAVLRREIGSPIFSRAPARVQSLLRSIVAEADQ
jgi:hypothetical protein